MNGEKSYLVNYVCYDCQFEWEESYSCACDSECPNCNAKNVTAMSWEEEK